MENQMNNHDQNGYDSNYGSSNPNYGGTQGYSSNQNYNGNPNYNDNPNYNNVPNYNNQNYGMDTSPMSMGDWVLTLLALMIPCAGIILYFVWAFGSHGNINRRNFCRARLAILGVVVLLYVILVLLLGVSFAGVMSN